MNAELIKKWNRRVGVDDVVYHVGDFSFKGDNRGSEWEKRLNGTIVHIKGNHDKNNGVKTYIDCALMSFGGKQVFVTHIPPQMNEEIPEWCDFVLCGHVHGYWKHKYIGDTPMINVGIDVWNYEPIPVTTIMKYYSRLKKYEEVSR